MVAKKEPQSGTASQADTGHRTGEQNLAPGQDPRAATVFPEEQDPPPRHPHADISAAATSTLDLSRAPCLIWDAVDIFNLLL